MHTIPAPRVAIALAEVKNAFRAGSFNAHEVRALYVWLKQQREMHARDDDIDINPRLALALVKGGPHCCQTASRNIERLEYILTRILENQCVTMEDRGYLERVLVSWIEQLSACDM